MASPASVKGDPIPENNPVINLGELTHVEFANWFHDELLDIFKNKPNVEIDIANNTITVKIQKTPQIDKASDADAGLADSDQTADDEQVKPGVDAKSFN